MQVFPYEIRESYPHMTVQEAAIWSRYIATHPDEYTGVMYDVAVGNVPDFVDTEAHDGGDPMARLYQRRLDVVATSGGVDTIIEVKQRAGLTTVGQILGYMHLYIRDLPDHTAERAVIVCEMVDADTIEFAHASGVEIIVV